MNALGWAKVTLFETTGICVVSRVSGLSIKTKRKPTNDDSLNDNSWFDHEDLLDEGQ